MIEPKPLTKSEREDIEEEFTLYHVEGSENWFTGDQMRAVLAAEAYWREAVKNIKLKSDYDASYGPFLSCSVCGASQPGGGIQHKQDCAWLRSQE